MNFIKQFSSLRNADAGANADAYAESESGS
jgi:hypothetical protein